MINRRKEHYQMNLYAATVLASEQRLCWSFIWIIRLIYMPC